MIENFFLDYTLFISGILFTVAALVISETGKIFIGSIIYIIGDIFYLIYAMYLDNVFGLVSLTLAIIFGTRTLIKMSSGLYRRDLKEKHHNRDKLYYETF